MPEPDSYETLARLICPKCHGAASSVRQRVKDCKECQGTGLQFSGLTEKCQGPSWLGMIPCFGKADCPGGCQGRGRILAPRDRLERVLDAAYSTGLKYELTRTGFSLWLSLPNIPNGWTGPTCWGADFDEGRTEAVATALLQWVREQERPAPNGQVANLYG